MSILLIAWSSWLQVYCTIASALASGPLALSLYNAIQTLAPTALKAFLINWCDELQNELCYNPQGRLGRTYPALAGKIPNNFLDLNILQLYCQPVMSQVDPSFAPNSLEWLKPSILSTKDLALLCDTFFDWGSEIFKKITTHVWDGQFIWQLV